MLSDHDDPYVKPFAKEVTGKKNKPRETRNTTTEQLQVKSIFKTKIATSLTLFTDEENNEKYEILYKKKLGYLPLDGNSGTFYMFNHERCGRLLSILFE